MNQIFKTVAKRIARIFKIEEPLKAAWKGYKGWKWSTAYSKNGNSLMYQMGFFESEYIKYENEQKFFFCYIRKKEESTNASAKIRKICQEKSYKGILIYPHIVRWEPLQTPQQLLREFAKEGWLCFFCETIVSSGTIKEVEPNLYITGETDLVQAISDQDVIFLLTWMGSIAFLDQFPKRRIWYNILDDISIFSLYDKMYELVHYEMVKRSDWVSYVAEPLLNFIHDRDDAVYLPNGCTPSDFKISTEKIPKDMLPIVKTGHRIIGYYGMIAEWMDCDLVYEVACRCPEYEFVFIGPIAISVDKLAELPNIHIMGPKKYKELPNYAACFDVATIPFKINPMMDCVSPIKFYEYCACGKPVICSRMKEVENYECEFIVCIDDINSYEKKLREFVLEEVKKCAVEKAPQIARMNSWNSRIKEMERIIMQ